MPVAILVHPGASAPSRRYPAEQFARAARSVARPTDCALVFTGTAAERPLVVDPRGARRRVTLGGGRPRPRRSRRARGLLTLADQQQHGARPRGRGRRDTGGRSLCPDQPAAHAVGVPHRVLFPRRAVQVLLQEHLPAGPRQLLAPRRAGGGRGGSPVVDLLVAGGSAPPLDAPSLEDLRPAGQDDSLDGTCTARGRRAEDRPVTLPKERRHAFHASAVRSRNELHP